MRKLKMFFKSQLVFLMAAFPALADKPVLTIYTYDSFISEWGPGPAIEKNFEAICACDVNFVGLDSSLGILGRLQLEGSSSKADIALGLDTNVMAVAHNTGLFAEHGLKSGANMLPQPIEDEVFLPFDWGYFAFVYDTSKMANPPASLDALINTKEDIKIAIQDPRTSTPGLGLLLWMKSVYGEDAAAKWQQLQPKILTVTKGWWDAYSLFLEGEADMVLSYTTSPAYHIIAEGKNNYAAADFAEGHYVQIEVAAMLKSAPQPELARQFLSFMHQQGFQSVIPTTNWMYPVTKSDLPEGFEGLVQPANSFLFTPDEVAKNQKNWINEWVQSSK
ncbi:MAG: thiamine ABC transporter substrate binding subunit [Candidatus Puniceispirillaceae bacterium]